MGVTVTKAGPYFDGGASPSNTTNIKFRQMRDTFRLNNPAGAITASELRRDNSTFSPDPIVPDCTENSDVATSTNWKVSQIKASIKYYYITQTGTDSNFDIDAQAWNSNLSKNIVKEFRVNGTLASSNTGLRAAVLNGTTHNFKIDLGPSGKIHGAGGVGGTSGSVNGKVGGDALEITNVGNNVTVDLETGSQIYGGGGGGEYGSAGSAGANGNSGTCWNWENSSVGSGCGFCGDCINLGSEWEQYGGCNGTGGCNCGGWWWWSGCSSSNYSAALCRRKVYTTVAGGAGGAGGSGGNGGNGQGYGQSQTNGSAGGAGGSGTAWAGCGGYAGTGSSGTGGANGNAGELGGNGGDWGEAGSGTSNSGTGGTAGVAIYGAGPYTVTGTINSTTIKGSY